MQRIRFRLSEGRRLGLRLTGRSSADTGQDIAQGTNIHVHFIIRRLMYSGNPGCPQQRKSASSLQQSSTPDQNILSPHPAESGDAENDSLFNNPIGSRDPALSPCCTHRSRSRSRSLSQSDHDADISDTSSLNSSSPRPRKRRKRSRPEGSVKPSVFPSVGPEPFTPASTVQEQEDRICGREDHLLGQSEPACSILVGGSTKRRKRKSSFGSPAGDAFVHPTYQRGKASSPSRQESCNLRTLRGGPEIP